MLSLFENFSFTQILTFVILLAIAFKEMADFIDWCKNKILKHDNNIRNIDNEKQDNNLRLYEIEKNYEEISKILDKLNESVNLLIKSDRDDIKAYVTKEHHKLCYEKGWVDDYTLDCLEKRYSHYVEEHGNSFVEQLMNEIRALPKLPPNSEQK